MKAKHVLTSVFALSALLAPASAFATVGSPVLQFGSTGPDVQELQTQLQQLGYFPSYEGTTQYFGVVTTAAVHAFKQDFNLTGGDAVGTTTEKFILEALAAHYHAKPAAGNSAVNIAVKYLGTPYAWGGTTPAGFDCSGFTQYVFEQLGIVLPRTSEEQYQAGQAVARSELQPGDLVFFTTYGSGATHTAVYIGNDQFVHSSDYGVRTDSLNQAYYASRFVGARRVLP